VTKQGGINHRQTPIKLSGKARAPAVSYPEAPKIWRGKQPSASRLPIGVLCHDLDGVCAKPPSPRTERAAEGAPLLGLSGVLENFLDVSLQRKPVAESLNIT